MRNLNGKAKNEGPLRQQPQAEQSAKKGKTRSSLNINKKGEVTGNYAS